AELKRQIAVVDQKKARFYSEHGFSENDVDKALLQISKMYQELKNLMTVQSNHQKADTALNEYYLKIEAVKSSPVVVLKRISNKIAELEDLMKEFSSMYKPVEKENNSIVAQIDTANHQNSGNTHIYYTVKSSRSDHETLSKIAKSIYGDLYRWPVIYNANRTQIDSIYTIYKKHIRAQKQQIQPSDFILPGQVLVIPMNAAD
ncbi:MAG TPA: hypothetical protein VHP36_10045, partial [Chitinispirillaceae bacterium]|nr:hypothetical protein [Chitinispirillaceae bacterium]